MLNASDAVAGLWLAVAFQPLSTSAMRGSEDSISATVHDALRFAVAARTRATSQMNAASLIS